MLARQWPGIDWFTADDRLIATAVGILEAEAEALEQAREEAGNV